MPFVGHEIAKCRVANGMDSNVLNCILTNERNCGKRFGVLLITTNIVLIFSIKMISSSISSEDVAHAYRKNC